MKAAVVGGALAFGLSGCATITEGKTDNLKVTSVPVDGAKCTLTNGVGTWYLTTPGNVEVHKSKTDLNVDCTHDGYQNAHQVMVSHFEGMTAGNIILGGVIGIGVDAASGAMNHYDKSIEVQMTPVGQTPAPAATPAPATAPATTPKTTS